MKFCKMSCITPNWIFTNLKYIWLVRLNVLEIFDQAFFGFSKIGVPYKFTFLSVAVILLNNNLKADLTFKRGNHFSYSKLLDKLKTLSRCSKDKSHRKAFFAFHCKKCKECNQKLVKI